MRIIEPNNPQPRLILIKQIIGYSLFAIAILYALSKTPSEIWDVEPIWLIPASLLTIASLFIQVLQLKIFMKHHEQEIHWKWMTQFTVRKGILNTLLPAKSGTLVLLHTLTKRYNLTWKDYVHFMLFCSPVPVLVSLVFLSSLLFSPLIFSTILLLTFFLSFILGRQVSISYMRHLPLILFYAYVSYFIFLGLLWCILLGLGYDITMYEASYFAIAINALSQISITPGNIGVRETILGILAPYLSLPISVGILSGAILFALRVAVSALILLLFEGRIIPKDEDIVSN